MTSKWSWPYYIELDWSAYHLRLNELLKLKIDSGILKPSALPLLSGWGPGLYTAYNWFPFYAEDRRKLTRFRTTQEIEFDPWPIAVDPDTGESNLLFPGPTLPAGVDAFLTVRLPLIDLNKRDITRVAGPFRKLLHEVLRNHPTTKEAPAMLMSVPPQRAFLEPPSPPEGEHSLVTFRVAISGMTTRDVGRTVTSFKAALHKAIETRFTENEVSDQVPFVPWPFLLHAQDDAFRRDISRYLLYHANGLSVRQIAYLEEHEKRGGPVKRMPRKIRRRVANESGVWESIARIYHAVHRKPLNARRRRLDTPAEGMPEYRCEKQRHKGGEACPPTCPTLQTWWRKIESTLPVESTGK